MRHAMMRFPVLTFVGKLLRWVAILCPVVGLIFIKNIHTYGFILSCFVGFLIWVYAELTGVVLSIEHNTYESRNHLATLVRFAEQKGLGALTEQVIVREPVQLPNQPSLANGSGPRTDPRRARYSRRGAPPRAITGVKPTGSPSI